MKLSGLLVLAPYASAIDSNGKSIDEWEQPTYWDAMQAVRTRTGGWGHPAGIRAAANWQSCPALATPEGASGVTCDGSTCMVVCQAGFQATGRRRIKCRWKKKHGFFWRNTLSSCGTCSPSEPNTTGDVSTSCSINTSKNRKVCLSTCPSGMMLNNGKRKVKSKCKCKKKSGCSWLIKGPFASFDQISCINSGGIITDGGDDGTDSVVTTAATGDAVTTAATGDAVTTAATGDAVTTAATGDAATTAATGDAATTAAQTANERCLATIPNNPQKVEICNTIDLLNTFRVQHGAAPVEVSEELCNNADAMADTLDDQNGLNGQIEHNMDLLDQLGEGENLYSKLATGIHAQDKETHMIEATTSWQNEKIWWTYVHASGGSQATNCDPPSTREMCGHFTQQVWKATTHVCYSWSQGPDQWEYIVARYKPRGNVLNQYTTNVLPEQ